MKLTKIYAQEIRRKPIDMALSENPLGCSPAVVKAIRKITIRDISCYPNTSKLKQAIATRFGIKPDNILLGCGSEQLIKLIAQTFMQKGETVLIQRGSFPLFTKECQLIGAKIKFFTPTEITKNLKARLIFLCNPNNPTGEVIDPLTINTIAQKVNRSLIVIDEANGEFLKNSFLNKATKSRNCIVLRTFSKVMGLAGLRIGFATGPVKLINKLTSAQQPFPISSIACKLASEALQDSSFVDKTIKFVEKERLFLCDELKRRELAVSNSVTNNLFIESPLAAILITEINRRGVSVIAGAEFPGMKKQGFRISIKDKKTNRLFLKKLDGVLTCLRVKKLLPSKKNI